MCEGGMERSPATNASEEVGGVGRVATGGATEVVDAGAEVVTLVSVTCTAADLCALGTL